MRDFVGGKLKKKRLSGVFTELPVKPNGMTEMLPLIAQNTQTELLTELQHVAQSRLLLSPDNMH